MSWCEFDTLEYSGEILSATREKLVKPQNHEGRRTYTSHDSLAVTVDLIVVQLFGLGDLHGSPGVKVQLEWVWHLTLILLAGLALRLPLFTGDGGASPSLSCRGDDLSEWAAPTELPSPSSSLLEPPPNTSLSA